MVFGFMESPLDDSQLRPLGFTVLKSASYILHTPFTDGNIEGQ